MAKQWTHTRQALQQLRPAVAAAYLTRLAINGPQIYAKARTLLAEYPLQDDRFKIHMINYLRQTLPGSMDSVYEALLQDIMADKAQLEA